MGYDGAPSSARKSWSYGESVNKLAWPHGGVKVYVSVKRGGMSDTQKLDIDRIRTQDFDHVWHPMMQHEGMTKDDLLVIVSADGCEVTDADGKTYLDTYAGTLICV
jgi:hypothetical protein